MADETHNTAYNIRNIWTLINSVISGGYVAVTTTATDSGTAITGQSLEAGGAGGLGWWSSIRKAITDRLGVLGQTTMNNSTPVVIASDQSAVPISAASLPLPSGAATSALQGGGLPAALGTGGGLKVEGVTATPTSYNVTLTAANTEYNQALPANCKGFEFQARTDVEVRYAFVTDKVHDSTAPFHTLKIGDYYYSDPINQGASPSTLYFASATAGVVMEILAWV